MDEAKIKAAALAVIATGSLTAIKLITGFVTGSVSVISEGVHSGTDLLAAVMALFAVRQAAKPPDRQHRYGHGKFESLSAALEALLIWVACYLVASEAIVRLRTGHQLQLPTIAIGVMILTLPVNFFVSQRLFSVARQTSSLALEADAWHQRADFYTTLAVIVGLILLTLTGWHWLDPLLALVVVVLVARAGYTLLRDAVYHLVDTALPPEEEAIVERALSNQSHRFINFHHLRTRRTGSRRNIDLHLVVRDDMTVDEAHQLCDEIEEEIRKGIPDADVTIHIESESAHQRQGIEEAHLPHQVSQRQSANS